MSRPELRPFADEHLEAAGELLAERHRRHRAAEPLLSERYETSEAARAEVEATWRRDGAAGAVALRGGRLVGYLLGAPEDEQRWGGPNVWVDPAGHAVAEAELARDLYALAAARWLGEGRARHYVVVPATDRDLADAWQRLCFGAQHLHGIREVTAEPWPDGVRRAEPRDVEAVFELTPLIRRQHARAPVFSANRRPDDPDAIRAEVERDIATDEIGTLVAELDGRVVGTFLVGPIELGGEGMEDHRSLARAEGACLLVFAATAPEARGSGAGVALTKAALAWAHEAGYRTMVTDWRVTNLLSSRFWPRRGFRPTFLRLYRAIP